MSENEARCSECKGIAVGRGCCVGHLDKSDLERYVNELGPGVLLNGSGASIDAARCRLLARLITTSKRGADFTEATFAGDADFTEATFTGIAYFRRATFTGNAYFRRATFTGNAIFGRARFAGRADFGGATFSGSAYFPEVTFTGNGLFSTATFTGEASFNGATFTGDAVFGEATFGRSCELGPLRAADVFLLNTVFDGPGEVHLIAKTVRADGVRYREALTLTMTTGTLDLSGARFAAPATVAASPIRSPAPTDMRGRQRYASEKWEAPGAPPPGLLTLQGADLTNLTVAEMDLSACRFIGAYNLDKLHIDGPPLFAETPARSRWTRRMTLAEERRWRAKYDRRSTDWYPLRDRLDQVLTLERRALSLDPNPSLPRDPALALRQLADYQWLSQEARDKYWQIRDEVTLTYDWLAASTTAARTEAARVQAVYRQLRKSSEDAKNEPGAADFYYGEMEMRRMATRADPPHRFENALLTAYWAVSGYGLRASRAFLTLLLALSVATVLFATVGFGHTQQTVYVPIRSPIANQPVAYRQTTVPDGRPGFREAAYYSVQSATSLLREPTSEPLTTIGRTVEIALRLLGPLLLGLALLALRGRVKR